MTSLADPRQRLSVSLMWAAAGCVHRAVFHNLGFGTLPGVIRKRNEHRQRVRCTSPIGGMVRIGRECQRGVCYSSTGIRRMARCLSCWVGRL